MTDLTDAYENGAHIPGGAEYPPRWVKAAQAFRECHDVRELDQYHTGTRRRYSLSRQRPRPKAHLSLYTVDIGSRPIPLIGHIWLRVPWSAAGAWHWLAMTFVLRFGFPPLPNRLPTQCGQLHKLSMDQYPSLGILRGGIWLHVCWPPDCWSRPS